MAKLKQLVYNYNYKNILLTENIFESYAPIIHIGIQGPANLKFYFNKNYFAPLYTNNNGFFEVDLTNTFGLIESIQFDKQSLEKLLLKTNLIIDILYEGEGDTL